MAERLETLVGDVNTPAMIREPTTLFIDADDTLWENNIYFEQVAKEFVALLEKHGHHPDHVGRLHTEADQRTIKVAGYGSRGFCLALRDVVQQLDVSDLEGWIQEKENWICHHPVELMPGVREVLPLLHAENRTILLTKGRKEEQLGKLERSGLTRFFHTAEVVFEKSVETYLDMIAKYHLSPGETWMIGNSPRSDINPAKAAGLGAIFIPYHTTWWHELEEITPDGRTHVLENFGQLAEYFVQKSD
jgi:putative hydrolase of the HAD superfamily